MTPINSLYMIEDFKEIEQPKYTLDFLLKDDLQPNNLPKDYVKLWSLFLLEKYWRYELWDKHNDHIR